MFVVPRILEQMSALFIYAATMLIFGGMAVAGSTRLAQALIGPLTLNGDPPPPSRVAVGLAAQDRAALHQPIHFEMLVHAPPAIPFGTLAKQMDEAEASTAPVVAGWVKRLPPKPTVALEDSPGDMVLRSLRADL